jgi:hypothetical protein
VFRAQPAPCGVRVANAGEPPSQRDFEAHAGRQGKQRASVESTSCGPLRTRLPACLLNVSLPRPTCGNRRAHPLNRTQFLLLPLEADIILPYSSVDEPPDQLLRQVGRRPAVTIRCRRAPARDGRGSP